MTAPSTVNAAARAGDGPRRTARRPRTRTRARRASTWAVRAPLLPALVFVIAVTQLPFLTTLVLSLFDWNSFHPGSRRFTGLANYATVLGDSTVREAVVTTTLLTASVVAAALVLGLALALLLDRRFPGRALVRTMLITPFLLVPVAAALLWKHLLLNPEYGLLNGVLAWASRLFGDGGAPQPDWVSAAPLIAVGAALVWQWTPFMMLIVLAGLRSRPYEATEAARLDGASEAQIFRYLTLPHLRRYLELGALLGSIHIVQNFDAVFTITSGSLGTANLPYTIYQIFYQAHEYGQASAAGVLAVLGSLVIASVALRVVSSLLRGEASRG
ncbi:ABC transporter permease subunit [Streptomyces sp. NRRL B-1677]|uniref:carbohydrate ABC transporter permease n=1 Tax=Streptomyces sp. NRRL B-1677 TaxID=2682966 RepID=UPI001892ADA7|nr:sugar ABC transporter permease [Streptomyces sp. NRRL B-1677]MBF6049491.1 ABC transporter permease subunit [Streptomyces sp. NRRL B-1677]